MRRELKVFDTPATRPRQQPKCCGPKLKAAAHLILNPAGLTVACEISSTACTDAGSQLGKVTEKLGKVRKFNGEALLKILGPGSKVAVPVF